MDALPFPPTHLIKHIGGESVEDFESIAAHFFEIFRDVGGIKPTDRVLDVGCGCGRMAIPLARFLTTGTYQGFDILPELIEWCQTNITPRFPSFQFQLVNVRHDLYSKDASLPVSDFSFPFEDDSFDFTFLTSVFTHLVPEDLERYTAEIARTLRPGGTALITYFILNEESETLMKEADSKMNIEHEFGRAGAKVMDVLHPEAVIAFPETYVRRVLSQSGLTVQEPIHFGFWCGRPSGVTFQDLVVCRK